MTETERLVASPPDPRLAFTTRGIEVVGDEQRGRTVVAERVVASIAKIASTEADAIKNERGGWMRMVRKGLPTVDADVRNGQCRITVEVAAVWPLPLSLVARQVRERIHHQVEALTGIPVAAVDVTIAEVAHLETKEVRVR